VILHSVERGAGAPLALLHGLYGQANNFATVQKRLAQGRRVIAFDLRNHGQSPHAASMSYPAMAEDVLETLRELGALPCALVGHSMGGKVAMRAALEAPAAVSRLLVADIAPVAYDHAGFHGDYVAAMRGLPLRPGLTRAEADAALAEAVPDKATRSFLLTNLRFGATPSWRLNLPAIEAALPALAGWPDPEGATYPGPTLFLAGARSDYVLPKYRPAIRALFPASRVVTLKDSGHWVHADDPDGFVSVAETFIPAA
jgi:pimeloyl-ACP methyl ester carboxylesterase